MQCKKQLHYSSMHAEKLIKEKQMGKEMDLKGLAR